MHLSEFTIFIELLATLECHILNCMSNKYIFLVTFLVFWLITDFVCGQELMYLHFFKLSKKKSSQADVCGSIFKLTELRVDVIIGFE